MGGFHYVCLLMQEASRILTIDIVSCQFTADVENPHARKRGLAVDGFDFWLQPLLSREKGDEGGKKKENAAGDKGVGREASPSGQKQADPDRSGKQPEDEGLETGWNSLVTHLRTQT